jgi:protein tyrosine phosphatase (PTP) superfamily phosphohydrolase (DUF442 family)
MRSRWLLVLVFGLGTAGCCTPVGYRAAYPGRPLLPGPCTRCGTAAPLPPGGLPPLPHGEAPPPGVTQAPVGDRSTQIAFAPPVPGDPPFSRFDPNNSSRLYPPLPTTPQPALPPQVGEGGVGGAPSAKLLPPQSLPSPNVKDLGPMTKETEEPPILPADIPQFSIVKKGVASGQQPFPDGVKWLKEHGYKTVLHVRGPNETDNAAKRIFENRGLTYISLEVSPQTLTKDVVERFNQIVGDEKNRPLFVFDKNSSLAGGMWYLHFRTVMDLSDEKARAESSRLGFRQDQDDNHRDMWIAVQNYLKNQNP